ncbi:MAG: hypothetical protein WC455_12290 [Dehalococcoidia bacterium]|jgi:hypothetical protein
MSITLTLDEIVARTICVNLINSIRYHVHRIKQCQEAQSVLGEARDDESQQDAEKIKQIIDRSRGRLTKLLDALVLIDGQTNAADNVPCPLASDIKVDMSSAIAEAGQAL